MTRRVYGEPAADPGVRRRKAVASGVRSVEVGRCVGPRYRGVAYEAVQQLGCAVCGGDIGPGALFTRRAVWTGWGRGIQAVCGRCGPVELVTEVSHG